MTEIIHARHGTSSRRHEPQPTALAMSSAAVCRIDALGGRLVLRARHSVRNVMLERERVKQAKHRRPSSDPSNCEVGEHFAHWRRPNRS